VYLSHFLLWRIHTWSLVSRRLFWFVPLAIIALLVSLPRSLCTQYTPRPHTLPSLSALRASLRAIGTRIANEGTPKALGPFVIGLTG